MYSLERQYNERECIKSPIWFTQKRPEERGGGELPATVGLGLTLPWSRPSGLEVSRLAPCGGHAWSPPEGCCGIAAHRGLAKIVFARPYKSESMRIVD